MASFTSVADTVVLAVPARGKTVDIALSGTEADPFSAAV